MNKKILFSPVGGTDPIASSNMKDGSLLHICRVYKPDQVIMYMSKEILENHKKDNRYIYCLDKLCELQNRSMEYRIIERPDLEMVQDFDFFYKEFKSIISKITDDMDETDTLILNVSSGTPAMKSGLIVLRTLGEFPCKTIQVVTPDKRMNEHNHRGVYELQTLWELDEDNEENFKDRTIDTTCPTLSMIKNEEIIKKHIEVYDYEAAINVAATMPKADTKSYLYLLNLAKSRVLLDFHDVDRIVNKYNVTCITFLEGDARECFEYALGLDIKLQRGEYADFIRAITPLVVDLLEQILKKKGVNLGDFTTVQANGERVWDQDKMRGTEADRILNERYRSGFRYRNVYSDHLRMLIQDMVQDDQLNRLMDDLRNVESKVRNMAAHDIVSITEKTIKRLTGFTGQQIMNKLKQLFEYTDISVTEKDWDSYKDFNQEILKAMRRED